MIDSKRTLFRPAALAQYGKTAGDAAAAAPRLGVWALLRLAVAMVGSMLLTPFTCWRRRHVPVVLQMTTTQCGAACLTMVLRFHGRAAS
ncbi:MAG: hypothetical protein KAX65_06205, partial [Caldilineaceae bacterium]|nr:hypothetical protein [Caldilineaceae bacterium]